MTKLELLAHRLGLSTQPRIFLICCLLLFGCERSNCLFACHFGVPGGDAYAIANIVAKHIDKNYAFADRTGADTSHSGKIYYVVPGCVPSFTFYEIVEPIEIRVIEELVRQSLPLAGIDKVSLVFYEKQNWVTTSDNGGGHRGHENAIKRITVENQADSLFLHESGVMKTPHPGLEQ